MRCLLWHGHEHELSRGCRTLQQLVRAARFSERQALGHDRLDLATTKQLEQREEVLPEPLRVAVAQLVDPVAVDPPAGREQAPEKHAPGPRVPLSTAYLSGTQTRSASAPHTVSAATRSPSRSLEQPGP